MQYNVCPALPLEGIRVVAWEHVLAMPYCTMVLADLGAEVIKIERPDAGDDSRSFGPFKNGESGYFISVNRNKKSIAVDVTRPEGRAIVLDLVRKSDVFVENYRPGTAEKLGLDYMSLRKVKPDIIYVSITGFGHNTAPGYNMLPGYDIIAQAYGGLMDITGYPETPPTRVGASIADIISGLYAAIGILAAIRRRDLTGEGCMIDVSMVDVVLSVLENAVVRYTMTGEIPKRIGSRHPSIAPFDVFKALDGWVVIAVGNERLWQKFCEATGMKWLMKDPRFGRNELRVKNYDELKEIITKWTSERSVKEILETLRAKGVPCSPVNNVKDIVNDVNIRHRNMIVSVTQPRAGEVKITNNPLMFSFAGRNYSPKPAPQLGEHTHYVLREILGYSEEFIEELKNKYVVR